MSGIREASIAVLFSGGRDSSLAACLLAARGNDIVLLTGRSGTEAGAELTDIRAAELRVALNERLVAHRFLNTRATFREIAIKDIEADFAKYGKNLILVGATLALIVEAIIECKGIGITTLASGSTRYQNGYGEQTESASIIFTKFLKGYGIDYIMPVFDYESEDEVKYDLAAFGVTTKSLEAVSVFSDSFSDAPDDVVASYLADKATIARSIISLRTTGKR